ncbi:MAG: hypothetical protein ACFFBD_24245 [Candidatus Hodarchaeota archaeon]
MIKTDKTGVTEWSQNYGGSYTDRPFSLIQTSDGGFALGGGSRSSAIGTYDFWLVRTDAYGTPPPLGYSSSELKDVPLPFLPLLAALAILVPWYKRKNNCLDGNIPKW